MTFKKIECQIVGKSPLLMSSPKAMLEEDDIPRTEKQKGKKLTSEEQAERLTYRKKNGELYVPATAIKGCIIDASAYEKVKFGANKRKYALKPIIASAVRIEPFEIGLGTKKYEISKMTAVNRMKGRIVIHRPMLEKWKLKFDIIYDDNMIAPKIIKERLQEAGMRVGILAFRPSKMGNFGKFSIQSWVEKK